MAGELQFSLPGLAGRKLRAILWDGAGQVYRVDTAAFGAWSDAQVANYAIALVEQGVSGRWVGSMPAVAAGVYRFEVVLPVDQSDPVALAVSDPVVGVGGGVWSGTGWATLAAVADAVDTELSSEHGAGAWGAAGLEGVEAELELVNERLDSIDDTLEERTVYAVGSEPPGTADLSIRRGDTVAVEIGDLSQLVADWDSIWVTIKKFPSDADDAAVLRVRLDSATPPLPGLERVNGLAPAAAAVAAETASITDVDTVGKKIVLRLLPALSRLLSPESELWWDAQMLKDGDVVTLTVGARSARVFTDITQAIT